MQVKGTLMNQTLENGKKQSNFEPDFGPLGPNLGLQFIYLFIMFFLWVLSLLDVRHCHKL